EIEAMPLRYDVQALEAEVVACLLVFLARIAQADDQPHSMPPNAKCKMQNAKTDLMPSFLHVPFALFRSPASILHGDSAYGKRTGRRQCAFKRGRLMRDA